MSNNTQFKGGHLPKLRTRVPYKTLYVHTSLGTWHCPG